MATMLVVDDERYITQVLVDFLTVRGHDVSEAQSGTQALALARQRIFDVIFLDVPMPGMEEPRGGRRGDHASLHR
jgi:CheY-like chemotaxis protein